MDKASVFACLVMSSFVHLEQLNSPNVDGYTDPEPALPCVGSEVILGVRWGIVADIHANADALERVLSQLERERVNRIIVLGDMLGFGPHPERTIQLLRSAADMYILGDYDAAVLGKLDVKRYPQKAIRAIEWTQQVLSKSSKEWLVKRVKASHWKDCMFVHGTPLDPLTGLYTEEAIKEIRRQFAYRHVFSAHTHSPGIVGDDGVIRLTEQAVVETCGIVSVGSVGWIDGITESAKAHFVVWDSVTGIAEFKYVSYNPATVMAEMRELGLPLFAKSDLPKAEDDLGRGNEQRTKGR